MEEYYQDISSIKPLEQHVTLVSLFFTFLIIVTILFECITEKIEHLTKEKEYIFTLINSIYRELTILGLISFLLFSLKVIKDGDVFEWIIVFLAKVFDIEEPKETEEIFEDVHMLLFMFAIIYAIIVVYILLVHVFLSKSWERIERKEYKAVRSRYKTEKQFRMKSCWWIDIISHGRFFWRADAYEYHRLRIALVRANGLEEDFNFAKYLKYAMRDISVKLLNIKTSVFVIFILVIWLNWARFKIDLWSNDEYAGLTVLLIGGILLILLNLLLWVSGLISYYLLQEKRFIHAFQGSHPIEDTPLLVNESGSLEDYSSEEQKEQLDIFFFSNPNLFINIFQVILMAQAWYFGITGIYYLNTDGLPWIYLALFMAIPIISLFFFCPAILRNMVMTMYTGQLSHEEIIKKTLKPPPQTHHHESH